MSIRPLNLNDDESISSHSDTWESNDNISESETDKDTEPDETEQDDDDEFIFYELKPSEIKPAKVTRRINKKYSTIVSEELDFVKE